MSMNNDLIDLVGPDIFAIVLDNVRDMEHIERFNIIQEELRLKFEERELNLWYENETYYGEQSFNMLKIINLVKRDCGMRIMEDYNFGGKIKCYNIR